jgi:hypothetical protein
VPAKVPSSSLLGQDGTQGGIPPYLKMRPYLRVNILCVYDVIFLFKKQTVQLKIWHFLYSETKVMLLRFPQMWAPVEDCIMNEEWHSCAVFM